MTPVCLAQMSAADDLVSLVSRPAERPPTGDWC